MMILEGRLIASVIRSKNVYSGFRNFRITTDMKNIIILFLYFLMCGRLSAQIDTLFWFVAPDATSGHGDAPVVFRIASFGDAADVVIDQPANPQFSPITVNVPANAAINVDMTPYLVALENVPSNTVLNKGIRIRSNEPITAYYELVTSCQCNPEIFALKGRNALGTEFYTPFQTVWNGGGYAPLPLASIDIVATENNTSVTITPSVDVAGHMAGIPFTITLDRGETFSVASLGNQAGERPAGTHITSNKPIAITIKDDSVANGGCADIMGDQVIPTDLIGTDYIVMRGFLSPDAGESFFVLATEDNTEVFIDGSPTASATLQTGEQWQGMITNATTFIQTSLPAYVLHATGEGCELAEAVLPPIVCTGSRKVFFVRSVDGIFGVNLMTRSENVNSFTMNGNAGLLPANAFTDVPGTNGVWKSAQFPFDNTTVPAGDFTVVENSAGLFHLGTINGGSGGCRYGYFSDFGKSNPLDLNSSFCEGDTITLTPNGDYISYLWSTGATSSSLGVSEPGTYTLTVETSPECVDTDTITIAMFENPEINLAIYDTLVCDDPNPVIISAPNGFQSYLWVNESQDTIADVQTVELQPGRYDVIAEDTNGCTWPSVTPVYVVFESCVLEIPNIITPDGPAGGDVRTSRDNNAFFIASLSVHPGSRLTVYDRWGKITYHSDDYKNDWVPDDVSDGVYYYILELRLSDGSFRNYSGYVTILKSTE